MLGLLALRRGGTVLTDIVWDLDLVEPAGTRSGIPLSEPLEQHLQEFVRVEHCIYDVLSDLDKSLRQLRNAKAS